MRLQKFWIALALVGSVSAVATTEKTADPAPAKIKYKSGKDLNFEEMLIQGELKRPELAVITGNSKQGSDGLLRLRENFIDRIANDAGEDAK